jgi:hypothetical protein
METPSGLRLFACLCLLAAAFAAPAAAQAPDGSRITLSGAGGIALPLHGDFDFNAPEWQLAVRATVSRHFLLEGFFDQWRKKTQERGARFESSTTYAVKTAGVNWLARGFIDRVAITGGGGFGFLVYDRRFAQSATDCQPTSCQAFDNRFSSQSFTVQGLIGLEVPITSFVSAVGQYQFVTPIEDVGFSHSSVTGGVRVRIW